MKPKSSEGKGIKREIKFRAWVIKDKKMDYQPVAFDECTSECQPLNPVIDSIQNSKEPFNQILMQYTGLKDKNGKEIYEGDIVGGDFRRNVKGKVNLTKAQIKFYQGCFWLQWIEDSGKMPMHNFDTGILIPNTIYEVKIIGNIYENPDLLFNHPTHH